MSERMSDDRYTELVGKAALHIINSAEIMQMAAELDRARAAEARLNNLIKSWKAEEEMWHADNAVLEARVKELEEIDGAVVGDGSLPFRCETAPSIDEAIEAWIADDGENGPCAPGVYDVEVHTWKCFPLRKFRVKVPDNNTTDDDPTWEEIEP